MKRCLHYWVSFYFDMSQLSASLSAPPLSRADFQVVGGGSGLPDARTCAARGGAGAGGGEQTEAAFLPAGRSANPNAEYLN